MPGIKNTTRLAENLSRPLGASLRGIRGTRLWIPLDNLSDIRQRRGDPSLRSGLLWSSLYP